MEEKMTKETTEEKKMTKETMEKMTEETMGEK